MSSKDIRRWRADEGQTTAGRRCRGIDAGRASLAAETKEEEEEAKQQQSLYELY